MRVAMIDPSLFTVPYDCALAQGLQQAGCQVTLYGRRPGPDDNQVDGVTLSTHFYPVAGSPALSALPGPLRLAIKGVDHAASMARLVHRLRRARPDVIHFQWLPLPVVDGRFLSALRRVAPLLLTMHDTNPFNGDPTAGLQRRGFARCIHAFDRLVVHTAQGQERMAAHGIPPERVAVLPHGPLGTAQGDRAQDVEPDPMDGNVLTFVLFGKIKPYKGADLLIQALAALPPALRAQARVRIVGKPYMDLAPLHRLAEEGGVTGQVSIEPRFVSDAEIPALFGRNTVAVFPYREIEASGVLSIALAQGRPVVASCLGMFRDTLTDGVQGRLVPADDVPALAVALAGMAGDRRFAAACSAAALLLAGQAPSWAEIGRRTVELYEAVGGGRRADLRRLPGRPHPGSADIVMNVGS